MATLISLLCPFLKLIEVHAKFWVNILPLCGFYGLKSELSQPKFSLMPLYCYFTNCIFHFLGLAYELSPKVSSGLSVCLSVCLSVWRALFGEVGGGRPGWTHQVTHVRCGACTFWKEKKNRPPRVRYTVAGGQSGEAQKPSDRNELTSWRKQWSTHKWFKCWMQLFNDDSIRSIWTITVPVQQKKTSFYYGFQSLRVALAQLNTMFATTENQCRNFFFFFLDGHCDGSNRSSGTIVKEFQSTADCPLCLKTMILRTSTRHCS